MHPENAWSAIDTTLLGMAVLMEKIQGPQLWQGLGIQALWVILCLLTGRQLWLSGLRRYEAVGI